MGIFWTNKEISLLFLLPFPTDSSSRTEEEEEGSSSGCILGFMGSCLSLDTPRSTGGGDGRRCSKGLKKRKKKKKRGGSSSFRKDESEQLHKIPERLFFNGSTDITSLFTQQGRKGTNQDAMITWEVFFCLSVCLFIFFVCLRNLGILKIFSIDQSHIPQFVLDSEVFIERRYGFLRRVRWTWTIWPFGC